MSITLAKNKQQAIADLLKGKITTNEELHAAKRSVAKKYRISILENSEILNALDKFEDARARPAFRRLLRKRAVRTLSGIAPVAVLTRPWPCPGKCVYCPTEKDVPQSYLSNEPAVMRAIREDYDPYQQVQSRLRALVTNGHRPEKIELIVIGGTWSVLPEKYKYWYIANCFAAANNYKFQNTNSKAQIISKLQSPNKSLSNLKKLLATEQKKNEKAKYKIIGVTLETRPDYIDEEELFEMRELGCTRVELGVQAIDDKILKKNKRGHGVAEIAQATKLLKDFGFKVTYHIMPGLPGATPAKDLKMFGQLFADERFQPDQLKFYPTVVTRGSELYRWWRLGIYKPYTTKRLTDLIVRCKQIVPSYVRIIRLIRDIPGESIVAGNRVTNLRQVLALRGVECKCIRCREVKGEKITNYKLQIANYNASSGKEYFIEATDKSRKILYGFCRLRLAKDNLWDGALVRELHVYGELVPTGKNKIVQHAGLGKRLMGEAEKIARENGFEKIVVIAGVGVREYYRKLGHRQKDSYMVKDI